MDNQGYTSPDIQANALTRLWPITHQGPAALAYPVAGFFVTVELVRETWLTESCVTPPMR